MKRWWPPMFVALIVLICASVAPKPASAAGTRNRVPPTIMLLHGGGWVTGTPASMAPQAQRFARAGYRVVNVAYPLGNVLRAIRAVKSTARRIHGPVIALGVSAGGTLAAALAARGDIAGAVDVAGPTDLTLQTTFAARLIHRFLPMSYGDLRAASPLYRLNGHQAPQLVQCGAWDQLVSCSPLARYALAARWGQRDTTWTCDTTRNVGILGHGQSGRQITQALAWIQRRWPAR